MVININYPQNINFKGYAACPIKTLYLQVSSYKNQNKKVIKTVEELHTTVKDEGIDVIIYSRGKLYNTNPPKRSRSCIAVFAQDPSIFLPDGKLGLFNRGGGFSKQERNEQTLLANALSKTTLDLSIPTEGGNFFIGKKDNGEKYLLIGENALIYDYLSLFNRPGNTAKLTKEKISKETGIKNSNIYWVPQAKKEDALDFHIDMVIRPLKYPYVLVNDPHTVIKELKKINPKNEEQSRELRFLKNKQLWHLDEKELLPADRIIKSLEAQGFKPIRVPGIFWDETTNYTNAIVHERANGDLVYITNSSSESSDKIGANCDKIWKQVRFGISFSKPFRTSKIWNSCFAI